MNIKEAIKKYLDATGIPPSRLAKDAGCSVQSITRLLKGQRQGMNIKTWEKLERVIRPATGCAQDSQS